MGATITILITTLDDCVWLVPYLSPSRYAPSVCIQHGILFAITLISLTSIIGLCTKFIMNTTSINFERMIELFGVLLCWMLAIYFYYRSWSKQRQRRLRHEQEARTGISTEAAAVLHACNDDSILGSSAIDGNNYGSCSTEIKNNDNDMAQKHRPMDRDDKNNNETVSPWHNDNIVSSEIQVYTIITLTISGAMDEVSYFPSLLIGRVYTFMELLVGTIFTVCIMLLVVTQLLHHCQPILQYLDRIPLYGIIALYALLLTINLIVDSN